MDPSGREVGSAGRMSAAPSKATPLTGPLVLVVEDDADIAGLIRQALLSVGYRTALAGDGEQALLLAQRRTPDLVLLDWRLPGELYGAELMARLRALCSGRLPVVVISGDGDALAEARGAGAQDYLPKPFLLDDLLHVVDEYCP